MADAPKKERNCSFQCSETTEAGELAENCQLELSARKFTPRNWINSLLCYFDSRVAVKSVSFFNKIIVTAIK